MRTLAYAGRFRTTKMVVVVFALILAHSSKVDTAIIASISAAIAGLTASQVATAATTAITTAASVASAAIEASKSGYSITCIIEMENWTKHLLAYPKVQIANSGGLVTLAKNVMPAEKQSFAVRKPHGANGVYGTVSWAIGSTGRRAVIMWSAPYNFNFYSNWMGVGMTTTGVSVPSSRSTWFDQMYYGESSSSLSFVRGEYYYSVKPIVFKNSEYEMEGAMNNIHHAVVKVTIRPIKNVDLATPILVKLEALVKSQKRDTSIITNELKRRSMEPFLDSELLVKTKV
uniref:Echotoxin B1 n=1 Tax=Monoplex parthenopeus TaxID=230564 RepID=D3KVQ8_MONPT|nr:echotoxin B1 [Monoplex echo]